MNFMNILQRSLGLLLLLILLAVGAVVIQIAGEIFTRTPWPTLVILALDAVACVVAGYFLRTFWALLIVPVVYEVGAYLLAFLITLPVSPDRVPESFVPGAVFLIANEGTILAVESIVIALLALLGVLLGKRAVRTGSALAV